MPTTIFNSRNASFKGFGPKSTKIVSNLKWSMDVKTFIDLFGAVMHQTGAPRCACRKYLYFLHKQLLFQGSGYLVKTRNYPVFGLRLLGGDFDNTRSTTKMFRNEKLRPNADGVMLPVFMSWFWNRLYYLGLENRPSKSKATEVSRILAVLSFSKFLKVDGKRSRKRAERKYEDRVRSLQGGLKNEMVLDRGSDIYKEMVVFLSTLNINRAGKDMFFDRRCYSLKSLVGKKKHRPPVPPAYGMSHSLSAIAAFGSNDNYFKVPNRLVNEVDRSYYDRSEYDGKLHVISESGGKYRGICPYKSPYAHSTSLYKYSSAAIKRTKGNCNYNQERGHLVAKRFSCNDILYVSSDASDFTDTANVEQLALLADALGCSGSVHYHGMLRIKTFSGDIIKSDTPLMGWKGTFDLASLLLAFSVWRMERLGVLPTSLKVQCGDDLLGSGSYEGYKMAYESINCKLSEEKTVISKQVTIFCGKMFWNGFEITPIRFSMYDFGQSHKFIGKLIHRTRDFIHRCNYTPHVKRKIYPKLKKLLGDRYVGYLDFRLSSDLGGIPLNLGKKVCLKTYLESGFNPLFCALRNIPFESEDFDSYHECFSHLPLGKPYSIYGLGTSLSPGSWPKKKRATNKVRRDLIRHLWGSNKVGIEDVLDYSCNPYMLLRS